MGEVSERAFIEYEDWPVGRRTTAANCYHGLLALRLHRRTVFKHYQFISSQPGKHCLGEFLEEQQRLQVELVQCGLDTIRDSQTVGHGHI